VTRCWGCCVMSPALSPEQRARLIDLAREMFRDSPRAAMGIQFGGTVESGVAVASLIEGV
jgi:hypothetical protein